MISEKDIADFKEIDTTKARAAIVQTRYYHPDERQYKEGMRYLEEMLQKIELIQAHVVKQIPALFKPTGG